MIGSSQQSLPEANVTRVVFNNVNLFDGQSAPRSGQHVTVEGNRIIATGKGPGAIQTGDRVIDLAGKTLMPGMWIGHYHGHAVMPGAPAYLTLQAAKIARDTLMSGFTSVISAGSIGYVEPSLAKAIDEGMYPGPRILPGSRDVSGTGNNIDILTPWYQQVKSDFDIRCCDGADAFRHAVRDEVKRGAKIIKLLITGGHGAFVEKGRMEMSSDELRAAIDTAHERGVLIRGHLAGRDAVLLSVELGLDIVDHGDDMDEECIAAMVERGTSLAPSCGFPKVWLERDNSAPSDFNRADLDHMLNILPAANEAGVNIVLGDDYFIWFTPADEMEVYVNDAGIAPLDVMRWATSNGAKAARRDHDLGTIEVGKLADLLVIDGDPTQDIAVFKDPDRTLVVMKDGAFVKDELARVLPEH